MEKIKIICTYQQAEEINNGDNGCIAWGVCSHEDTCKTCPYDTRNIEFVVKESEV